MMMENKNNFGFLRLFFAFLVIVSHSPELLDGNRTRELLTMLFGTISFGVLAVDGFFLISGYLILKSFQNSSSIKNYFIKRCLRIYPAFIVATLFSIFIIAPLSGGEILSRIEVLEWFKSFARVVVLKMPHIDEVFVNNHYQVLNGSMWTIRLEFICYLLIPTIFYLKLLNKKYYLSITILSLILFLMLNPEVERFDMLVLGRLFFVFLVGGCFYFYQEKIRWNLIFTMLSIIGLLLCLSHKFFAELGVIFFGGYLLFNFALNYKNRFLNGIGGKTDISYGVYLYAWPVQSLFVQYQPSIAPYQLTLVTLMVVVPLSYLSFMLIEKPCMGLKNKWRLKMI